MVSEVDVVGTVEVDEVTVTVAGPVVDVASESALEHLLRHCCSVLKLLLLPLQPLYWKVWQHLQLES